MLQNLNCNLIKQRHATGLTTYNYYLEVVLCFWLVYLFVTMCITITGIKQRLSNTTVLQESIFYHHS